MAAQGAHITNFNSDVVKLYNYSESLMKTEGFTMSKSMAGLNNVSICVDGRSTKISKRRSRASKKVPTTVLRTDASNFRAMVEHFTGLPITGFDSQANSLFLQRPLPRRAMGSEQEQFTPTFGILDTSTFSTVFNTNQSHGLVDLESRMKGGFYFRSPCESSTTSQAHLMADMKLPANPLWHELHSPTYSASV